MVINSAIGHQHESKKCTSASCCSIHKIWKAIQNIVATGDKQAWKQLSQDPDRIAHVKHALLSSRAHNDAGMYPASHKHKVLQFDKQLRTEAIRHFGKAVTDLNALQVALFHRNEAMACSIVAFLRQHAEPSELHSFLNHVWGERNTSLHLACFYGMPRLVRMLLDIGVSPDTVNARQLKPADCCKHPGCLASLELKSTTSPPPARRQSLKATTITQPTTTTTTLQRRASLPTLKDGIKRSNATTTTTSRQIKSAPPSPTSPVTRRPVWATTTTKTNSNVMSTQQQQQQRRVVSSTAIKPSTGVVARIKKSAANDNKPADPLKQKSAATPVIVQPKEKEKPTPTQSPTTPVAKPDAASFTMIKPSSPSPCLDVMATTTLPETNSIKKPCLDSIKEDHQASGIAQDESSPPSPPAAASTSSSPWQPRSSCTGDTTTSHMGHDPLPRMMVMETIPTTVQSSSPLPPGIHASFDHDPTWLLPAATLYLQVAIACFNQRLDPKYHHDLMRTCRHSANRTTTTAMDVHGGLPMMAVL
ncbi:hypothetical protein O0I10_009894 [Lichtheimia ornata]|uniref:ANK_REP_REGION domain-containing protein n=1 Tax=Lichtheimia ornata TaxID=688661 RepID=A0AAD7UVR0_9FUNG|nr:uncharacterized protein O0I10_009894 [Lichtheimia ornata]KAJ8654453.1 hypothetical protein O0I10_009894 [Lichtheimia ornata]